jgi:hypothetical protein
MLDHVFAPFDSTLLSLLVVALSALAAFNLFLSLRLTKLVGALAHARLPDTVPIGIALPAFRAQALDDGRRVDTERMLAAQAAVLVFLNPGCKSCQERLPELRRMRPLMDEAGVALWVIVHGRKGRLRAYFEPTGLQSRVLRVSDRDMRALNPKYSAPFYIFIDAMRIVRASNLIGDEDWLSFREQIGDFEFGSAHAADTKTASV